MRLVTRTGRVGIFGGTFDPIHVGHVAVALAAQAALRLDPVILMPARVPPHRQHGPSASTFHRFAMSALAVIEHQNIVVSDEELESQGPSYTASTLERLTQHGLEPTQIFFITGADAFAEIETWYRFPVVLEMAHFVVISRPSVSVDVLKDRLPRLNNRFVTAPTSAAMPSRPSIFLVDASTPDVSSTEIRRRLGAGERVTGLTPRLVEQHIARHRLYVEPSTIDICDEARKQAN